MRQPHRFWIEVAASPEEVDDAYEAFQGAARLWARELGLDGEPGWCVGVESQPWTESSPGGVLEGLGAFEREGFGSEGGCLCDEDSSGGLIDWDQLELVFRNAGDIE